MSGRLLYPALVLLLVSTLVFSSISNGQIISNVELDEYTFSPDSDGVEDSTFIMYTISDTAFVFYAFILSSDTSNTIDILANGVPKSDGRDTTAWDGKDSLGITVPEGHYLLYLRAENASGTDSVYKDIAVDLTPTQVEITSIEPSMLIVPGLSPQPIRIYYSISDTPPSDSVFVKVFILNPNGSRLDTLVSHYDEPNPYLVSWDGMNAAVDGIHQVQILAADDGGHSDTDYANINVDLDPPDLEITSPKPDKTFREVPDSIKGWAYDRNGLTSVEMHYGKEPFQEVPIQWMEDDTLFFSALLADSIIEEKKYTLRFRVFDLPGHTFTGRETNIPFNIELDTTPPDPPILDPPQGPVRFSRYTLTGSINLADTKNVIIYQNSVSIDTILILPIDESLSAEVLLLPGENVFTAIAVDDQGSASSPSNAITVLFDATAGLFIPQPFRPNNVFQLNLADEPTRVNLRIYDLSGDLVASISSTASGSSIEINWDGLNGQRKFVERGPLVAVAVAEYPNGDKTTFREIFLFDPYE